MKAAKPSPAYSFGFRIGYMRQPEVNPFLRDTVEAKEWEKGYHQGQAAFLDNQRRTKPDN